MRQHLWDLWGRESIQPPDCKHLCGFFTGVQNWSRLISSAYPPWGLGGGRQSESAAMEGLRGSSAARQLIIRVGDLGIEPGTFGL